MATTFDAHKDFAVSTVATAPSPPSSGTTLTVAAGDGAKFPSPAPFNCTVLTAGGPEIVRVSAVAGDTFTIARAQEGTPSRSIIAGCPIFNPVSAKLLTDIETAINTLSAIAQAGGSIIVNSDGSSTLTAPAANPFFNVNAALELLQRAGGSANFNMVGPNVTLFFQYQDSGGVNQVFEWSFGGANNNAMTAYNNPAVQSGASIDFAPSSNTDTTSAVVRIAGNPSQKGPLILVMDSAFHDQWAVTNAGSGAAPKWAMLVRAVANAESMAQLHTLGAYSGRAVQVVDDAGATVGWLPIYA